MPSGIILKSGSHEVSEEVREANLKAVVEAAGFEVPEAEPIAEPKREDFKTDEEHQAALSEWEEKQEGVEEEKEEEIKAATPKKSRKDRWVARATAEKDQRIKELEEQLAAAGTGKGEEKKETTATAPGPKPKRADFEDDDSFDAAYEKWFKENQALNAAQAAENQRQEQNLLNYAEQVKEAKARYPDWDKVVNKDVVIGNIAQIAILELEEAFGEDGAEVSYYLGQNPAEAKKLGKMSQVSAAMKIGRISAMLNGEIGAPAPGEANGEGKPRIKPKVPAPVRTVNTGGSSGALTFKEIAAKPDYPGKAGDLKKALAEGRN